MTGPILEESGVQFRVWAPHAELAAVVGDFNEWDESAHPMEPEGEGVWSAFVPGAGPGQAYRYLLGTASGVLSRMDPCAREVTGSTGNSVVHDPAFPWGDGAFEPPSLHDLVIYEMHVGTFHDDPGGPPGTFARAAEKLPYLQDLGINAIEVMPAAEFAGGFSWGYNPSHLFAIESEYGGPDAFKSFVREAHGLGIAVILDVVYNHFGPGDLDLWRFDGWHENDLGGVYFYNDWRASTPWGDTRPDYGRDEVRRFIRDNALMWLEEYRVDGLRWDMTAYIRNVNGRDDDPGSDLPEGWRLMQEINEEIRASSPRKYSIAEDLQQNPALTRQPADGGAGFDAQWDAGFVHPVRQVLAVVEDGGRDLSSLAGALSHAHDGEPFSRVVYTESHDEVANGKARLPEEIAPGDAASWAARKRSTLGAVIVFTAPGIPMIFQGQEFLEDGWFRDQDPLDWSRVDAHQGIVRLYRDLITLRRNLSGTTAGLSGERLQVYHLNLEDKVAAYQRWAQGGPGDTVVVVLNVSAQARQGYEVGFPEEGRWAVRFNSDWSGYCGDFGDMGGTEVAAVGEPMDDLPCRGRVDLGPYSGIILSRDH